MNVYPFTYYPPAPAAPIKGELELDVPLGAVALAVQLSADGSEYTAFPLGNAPVVSLAASAVPNFPGLTAALSQPFIGVGGYATPLTGVTAVLNGAGVNGSTLPAGITWNSATLSYNGTAVTGTVAGLSVTYTLTATGQQVTTNTFSIQGLGGAVDTFAPTIPTSLGLTLDGAFHPIITCDAQSDPSPPPLNSGDFTGMAPYPLTSNMGLNTSIPLPGGSGQYRDQLVGADIGSPAIAGSNSQAGAAITIAGTGVDFGFGASDQGHAAYNTQAVTGSFARRIDLTALANSASQQFAKFILFASPTLSPSDARVFAALTPPGSGGGVQMALRAVSGGSASVVATVAGNYTLPLYARLVGTYSGSWTFEFDTSVDGVTWSTVGIVTGVSMPASILTGMAVSSHDAVSTTSATAAQSCLSQDTKLSYTDTSVVQTAGAQTYTATLRSKDGAGNLSGTVSGSITIPGTSPVFSWAVSGNKIVDGAGATVTNFLCLAIAGMEVDSPNMWDGFYNTTPAQWTAIKNQANYKGVRIAINGWAARTNQNSNGGVAYMTILTRLRDYITGAGMYLIFDNHWDCPAAYNGGRANGQPGYMDSVTGPATITVLANLCKNNPATGIEVFNELFGNNGTDNGVTYGQNGSGSTNVPFYMQTGGKGSPVNTGVTMKVAGHQQLLNAARAAGFNGPMFFSCPGFNSNLGQGLSVMPTDSLGTPQVVLTIHYANGNDAQYQTVLTTGNIPIAMTEYYTVSSRGSGGVTGYAWAAANHISLWQWGAQNWGGSTTSNLATGTAGNSPALATAGAYNGNASLCQGYSWRFNAASIAFPGFPQ